jgi:hypothetical protein
MKRLTLFLFLATFSLSAFAQFPLGNNLKEIKAYFAQNIPYATIQKFKTEDGKSAVCFTKVRVVGDYTFYFDNDGKCSSYVVTYDDRELRNVTIRFNAEFCRTQEARWVDVDDTYDVTLVLPKHGENYFSVFYKPKMTSVLTNNTYASN